MWCKNIDGVKKILKKRIFVLLAGAILAGVLISGIIWLYNKAKMSASKDYTKIEVWDLDEFFPGGHVSLQINFIDNKIYFYAFSALNTLEAEFSEDEKKELLSLLKKYELLEWRNGRYYWDLSWNPKNCNVSDYTLNPDANAARRTDFVSLNKVEDYLGMGEDEFWFRTEIYWSELMYGQYNSEYLPQLEYHTYGVPDGYDELLDSIWDFALNKLHQADWKSMIDQKASEEMLKKFPYMGKETAGIPDSNKMWYFSINEFFGGKEHGPGVSLNFSRRDNFTPHQTEMIWYNTWYDADLNIVDTVGKVQKYREADEWFGNKWAEREIVMPFYGDDLSEEGKRKLAEILNKYQVATWQEPEYYQNQPEPSYIESGGFFNLSPNKQYEGISEQELEIRSTFETFIYLYDTDGKRLRLHYDNTGLPENYNEFREELWDFVMEYRMEQYDYLTIEKIEESDWRNHLDQWGREHLEIMQEKREDGRGTD